MMGCLSNGKQKASLFQAVSGTRRADTSVKLAFSTNNLESNGSVVFVEAYSSYKHRNRYWLKSRATIQVATLVCHFFLQAAM